MSMQLEAHGADGLRARLGPVGLWTFQLDALSAADERRAVAGVEQAGITALWLAEGTASKEALTHSAVLLAATESLTVATGIANLWARDAVAMASAARYLDDAFGGRFVAGIGVSHAVALQRRGHTYDRPLAAMREYLDHLDGAVLSSPEPARRPPRVLAALRPRMLELAAERADGAHTYFVPPEHTERARRQLGPEPVLAPEQAVVFTTDAATARAIAREYTSHYLGRDNYRNNLLDLGFAPEELDGSGTDLVVDALVAWGDATTVARRIAEHHDAGADHVAVQVLTAGGPPTAAELDQLAAVATDLPGRHR